MFIKKKYLLLTAITLITICFLSFRIAYQDHLTSENVKHAMKLADLKLTDSEIDSLLEGVNRNRVTFVNNRKIDIDNAVAPSLVFNPLPAGFQINQNQEDVVFEPLPKIQLPDNLDEIAFYSISQLASLIKNREMSSEEMTRFFIQRLITYDSSLHCVISITEELAIQQARRADQELASGIYRGLLHGIPYGAKDLLAMPGYKTTWGAMPFKDQMRNEEATVLKKLNDAGAVLVAKLTLGALAWGDVWYGEKTRNPWDTERGSSGSSAGSASAVSAGLVPFALGTETLGSIVSPSTVCGTTGLRPTFGAVSRYGAMALSWSMDKIGPICRSVEDCAIVFNTIRGKDPLDASTFEFAFNYHYKEDISTIRIGYLQSEFESEYAFQTQDSLAIEILRKQGIELIPVGLPQVPDIRFILNAEAAAAFDALTLSNEDDLMVRQIKNAWPNAFRTARFIPAVEYIQANRLRSLLIAEMDQLFTDIDVLVTPSWRGSNLLITNLTGHPQVVLPNGFRNGRPTSLSFTGKLFGEAKLLAFAKFYQNLTDHHLKHPSDFHQK